MHYTHDTTYLYILTKAYQNSVQAIGEIGGFLYEGLLPQWTELSNGVCQCSTCTHDDT